MKKFSLIFFGVLILAGCAQQVTQSNVISTQSQPKTQVMQKVSFSAVPGQKFGDMAFEKVVNNYATFTGTTELTGQYSTSELTGDICFYPDQNSAAKIPNLRGASVSKAYFCFSNSDEAKKLLGSGEGPATVTIKGYGDMTIDTSQEPFSELVNVISTGV